MSVPVEVIPRASAAGAVLNVSAPGPVPAPACRRGGGDGLLAPAQLV